MKWNSSLYDSNHDFAATLVDIPETQQINIFNEVEELTKTKLWNGKEWVADYRRLRVIAHV